MFELVRRGLEEEGCIPLALPEGTGRKAGRTGEILV